MQTIPITFRWEAVEPTPLPYWKSILGVSGLEIVVELPLTAEYIYNFEQITMQSLVANQKPEKPKLTVEGYKYCIDKLDNRNNHSEDFNNSDDFDFVPN